jgi:hypothetical protein
MTPDDPKPNFGQRKWMPFLAFLAFALLFAGLSLGLRPDLAGIDNAQIVTLFKKWTPLAGVALGFLSMIGMYLVRLFGFRKLRLGGPILLILGYAPWLAFGYQLAYREPRYATIAKAIIAFLGKPMLYASGAMVGLGVLLLIVALILGSIKKA